MRKKVALGMSGGVDSSVCAALLKDAGYEVTGVFLECWRAPGCRAEEDRKDALSVALQLGIPFQVLDFKQRYKDAVVEHFFAEYAAGRTPNPDVLCNKEIKFGLFYDWAIEQGFDAVATGHYAQIGLTPTGQPALLRGLDVKKDQSYFLYLLRAEQLSHVVFPIGDMQKTEVRVKAEQLGLPVASKPDSQGICFIGEINVHNFLRERLGENPGEVVNTAGEVIGSHQGLWFYTIGQRHGFILKGKVQQQNGEWKHVMPPFYVIKKIPERNQLMVGFGTETLCQDFRVLNMHWLAEEFKVQTEEGLDCVVRIRHGGALIPCMLTQTTADLGSAHLKQSPALDGTPTFVVHMSKAMQGVAEGQSAVFYVGEVCIGGGVIAG